MTKDLLSRGMNAQFRVFLLLSLLYALLIFYLSSISSPGSIETIINFLNLESLRGILKSIEHSNVEFLLYPLYIFTRYPDKMMHIALYAVFGFLLYLTLKSSSNPTLRNHAFIFAFIIGTAYGASDEFHQSFVPGRTASVWDLLADSIGLAIALAFIFMREKLRFKHKDIFGRFKKYL